MVPLGGDAETLAKPGDSLAFPCSFGENGNLACASSGTSREEFAKNVASCIVAITCLSQRASFCFRSFAEGCPYGRGSNIGMQWKPGK